MSSQLNCFRVGDYVDVDSEHRTGHSDSEGGKGYIEEITPNINVRYVISGLLSPDVAVRRLHSTRIATIGRRRNADGGLTPSILDYSYPEYRRQQQRLIVDSTNTSSTGTNNCHFLKSNCIVDTRLLLLLSIKSNTDIVDKNDKLNKTNTIGWLRINENINKQSTTTKDIHLMLEEKKLLKLVMGFKHLKCY